MRGRLKLNGRVVAFTIPAIAGIVAAIALAPSDLVAYLEGPLSLVIGVAGIVIGLVAAAIAVLFSRRNKRQDSAETTAQPSGERNERLAMLSNLYEAITARLVRVDAQLSDALPDEEAAAGVRREIAGLEQFLFDVHGVSSLHDVEPTLEQIDPAEMVEAVIDRTTKAAGERILETDVPSDPGVVHGDRKLLSLALINLIINSIKFSTPESPITVRAIDRGDRVVFQVEDRGPGVPPAEEVWGELARGSNAAGVPGAGLGLPLVKLVAEAHGGTARLDSAPSGTVAILEIPRQ